MEMSELQQAMTELARQGYSQTDILQRIVDMFMSGEISKGFMVACCHVIGVTTDPRLDGMSDEQARQAMAEQIRSASRGPNTSGREETAEKNNETADIR